MGERRLTAIPRNCFTGNYIILEASNPIARIDTPWFRGNVTLTVEETVYGVYREKGSRGIYLLAAEGEILARAVKPRAIQNSFHVELAGGEYTLKPGRRFRGDFGVFRSGHEVGSILKEGFFQRRVCISFPEDLPLPAGVFFLWLTLMIWRDDSPMIEIPQGQFS